MNSIDYNNKYYWNATKPVQKDNMFLDEDYNKWIVVDDLYKEINNISSNVCAVFSGLNNIELSLIDKTSTLFPPDSYILTINGVKGENIRGISIIDIIGNVYYDNFSAWYLPAGTTLVESLNNKTGHIKNILTGLQVNGALKSGRVVNLGEFFTTNQNIVLNVNNLGGNQWVIKTIKINGVNYFNLDTQYYIDLPNSFLSKIFKYNESLPYATIPSGNTSNSIVNLQMYKDIHKVSATIVEGVNGPFENVLDWICITNQNYKIIHPASAQLVNHTLTLSSTEPGIIYFYTII